MPTHKFISLPRPVKCVLQGDHLVPTWGAHREEEKGKTICEFSQPRNWTDRTLSAFLLLRSPRQIAEFVVRFGTLETQHSGGFELASTWLLWVTRAKAILSFNDAIDKRIRPTQRSEEVLANLIGGAIGSQIKSSTYHGIRGARHFFLMRAISAWLNSRISREGQGTAVKIGIQRKSGEITISHEPTCLLGFLILQILRRLQLKHFRTGPRVGKIFAAAKFGRGYLTPRGVR